MLSISPWFCLRVLDTHKKINSRLTRMPLWRKYFPCNTARSPILHSTIPKTIISTTKPTRVPMTGEELHGLVTPPHCSARMKHMTAAMMVTVPRGSICKSFSVQVALTGLDAAGVLKKMRITLAEAPPTGRFT